MPVQSNRIGRVAHDDTGVEILAKERSHERSSVIEVKPYIAGRLETGSREPDVVCLKAPVRKADPHLTVGRGRRRMGTAGDNCSPAACEGNQTEAHGRTSEFGVKKLPAQFLEFHIGLVHVHRGRTNPVCPFVCPSASQTEMPIQRFIRSSPREV
jgi:hypothetical protein